MSIKIEGGNETAENVIKAGTSNELLYNDKEVLLKEGLDLSLLPDLKKAKEIKLATWDDNDKIWFSNPITIPEDGWIIKVDFPDRYYSHFISIDGIGALRMTPSQEKLGIFKVDSIDGSNGFRYITIRNLNCPYPVKKGQTVNEDGRAIKELITTTITFAPCKGI